MTSKKACDPKKLEIIEGEQLADHRHLIPGDECYFFDEYPTDKDFSHGGRSRITNFKRSVDAPEKLLSYKRKEIRRYATLIKDSTFNATPPVPILVAPTSKAPGDPLYDDRLLQTIEKARQDGGKIIILDLFETITSRQSLHLNEGQRRNIEDIKASIRCKPDTLASIAQSNYRKIVFFDDMVTTGCTFVACRQKLAECLAQVTGQGPPEVIGMFLSRRVPPDPLADFDFEDLI